MISCDDVAAILVTRGDVEVEPIMSSLVFGEVIVWDNSTRPVDLGAFGRYEAIAETERPVVFFQDDDCLMTPEAQHQLVAGYEDGFFVSNMNPNHNGGLYPLLALGGWGSLVRRDLPGDALSRWRDAYPADYGSDDFNRIGCDIVVGVMITSKMIDLGHSNFDHAHAPNRTWRRAGYRDKKARYYRQAAALRGSA